MVLSTILSIVAAGPSMLRNASSMLCEHYVITCL